MSVRVVRARAGLELKLSWVSSTDLAPVQPFVWPRLGLGLVSVSV
jgi:hypothetical protein